MDVVARLASPLAVAAGLLLLAQVETGEQRYCGRLVACGASLMAKGKSEWVALEVGHN
jgi:hypothetical protein